MGTASPNGFYKNVTFPAPPPKTTPLVTVLQYSVYLKLCQILTFNFAKYLHIGTNFQWYTCSLHLCSKRVVSQNQRISFKIISSHVVCLNAAI